VDALVEKHGVNDATLKSRIHRGKWREERDQVATTVQQKLPEKIAEVILEEAGELTRRHFHLWQAMLQKAEAMLGGTRRIVDKEGGVFEVPAIDSPKDLKEWAGAVKAATEGQRLARGLTAPKEGGKPDEPSGNASGEPLDLAALEALDPAEAVRLYRDSCR
jgi:hypothetical protein